MRDMTGTTLRNNYREMKMQLVYRVRLCIQRWGTHPWQIAVVKLSSYIPSLKHFHQSTKMNADVMIHDS